MYAHSLPHKADGCDLEERPSLQLWDDKANWDELEGPMRRRWKEAAEEASVEAIRSLIWMTDSGDPWSELQLSMIAANKGDSASVVKVAKCFEKGAGVPQDHKYAWCLYQRAIRLREQQASDPYGQWTLRQGNELENPLRSGALALLDSSWLLDFAATRGRIDIRQKLPSEAFLSCEEVIRASSAGRGNKLAIIVVSHMWLEPQHPDPKGTTLQAIAKELKAQTKRELCRFGVFWDYASLYQHPAQQDGIFRTPHEEILFQQGLDSLGSFFSHSNTHVYRVTNFP